MTQRVAAARCVTLVAIVAALLAAVPATVGAQQGFSDVEPGSHKPAIDALNEMGLFEGTECGEREFCPSEPAKRWTVAVWLVRVLDGAEPPEVSESRFADVDDDEWWMPHVERLAELGVTVGCRTEPLSFCPDETVTRARMATFLVRAFDLEPADPAGFVDIEGSSHEANINALAAVNITVGCSQDPLSFCPNRAVTRAQMATFLTRALALLEASSATPDDIQEPVEFPGAGVDVTAGRADWSSGYFQGELYKQLLEELGYNVSDPARLELGPSIAYIAMAQGDMDYWPNSWYPAHYAWHAPELPDGTLVGDHVSVVGEELIAGGLQGFLVTKSFADAYGVYTMDDLNRNAEALAAFDATDRVPGDGKADIFGCSQFWTCGDIIESMITFGGWDNIVQTTAGYDVMFNQAVRRVNEGIPMVLYTWTPSAYITELRPGDNVYWMGVENILDDSNPAYLQGGESHSQRGPDGTGGFVAISEDQCPSAADQPSGQCKIGWFAADIQVTANSDFLAANPAARALFEAVRLSVIDVSLANLAMSRGESPTVLATQWIADNRDLVDEWLAAAQAAWPGDVWLPPNVYTDVATGAGHGCALRMDETIECWGGYFDHVTGQYIEQTELPEGTFSSVAAGWNHVCGLRTDGLMECWGTNTHGQARPPLSRVRFSAVDAGNHHSCGLGVDGRVTCWGANNDGQADSPYASRFTAVDAGIWHTCGLRIAGTISCWGSNAFGQSNSPQGSFSAVAAGALHSCGLRTDGTISCWGTNNSGGYVGQTDAPDGTFTAISAGAWYSCGIRTDGTIACWGHLLDVEDETARSSVPDGTYTAVSAGWDPACGINARGEVVCWS